jgi:hypothetical protein
LSSNSKSDTSDSDNEVTLVVKKPQEKQKRQTTIASLPTVMLTEVTKTRTNEVRLQLMIHTKKKSNRTANTVCWDHVERIFQALQSEDDKVAMFPWMITIRNNTQAITSIPHFPKTWMEIKPYVKTNMKGIQNDSDNWIQMCFATNLPPRDLTSLMGSQMSGWYQEDGLKAYLLPLQNSDTPVVIGILIYSGPWMDADQLCIDMIKELEAVERQGHKDTQTAMVWKIGMKSRQLYELKCTNEGAGYIMANNLPIRIEVDAAQAKKVNTYCYKRFNHMTSGVPRPGYCNLRYVPDKRFITTGMKGNRDRANMLKKHQAVVSFLKLLRTEEIKNLDTPTLINMTADAYEAQAAAMATSTVCADGEKTTLRKVLMELTFPLAPKDRQKVTKLFHSVDFATTGPTAGLEVLLTAYDDRVDITSSLVSILSAYYVEEFYGQAEISSKCWSDTTQRYCFS